MKKLFLLIAAVISICSASQAMAEEGYMTAEEVKALLTDKTFNGEYLPRNKRFTVYEDPDGTHNILSSNGKLSEGRRWWVDDQGRHCTTNPKWKKHPRWKNGRCTYLKKGENGEVHKYAETGEHTHTFSNFRDGNQLDQ